TPAAPPVCSSPPSRSSPTSTKRPQQVQTQLPAWTAWVAWAAWASDSSCGSKSRAGARKGAGTASLISAPRWGPHRTLADPFAVGPGTVRTQPRGPTRVWWHRRISGCADRHEVHRNRFLRKQPEEPLSRPDRAEPVQRLSFVVAEADTLDTPH